jgi:acetyl-CoA carboxylase biotin carboxyl carrier protein
MAAKAPHKQTSSQNTARRAAEPPSPYALNDLRVLAKIVKEYDLSEMEVEQGGQRIRLRRERGNLSVLPAAVAVAPAQVVPPAPTALPAVASVEPVAAKEDGTAIITSPFVGTFYRAPSPESPPFVEVGQSAKKGQVL